MSVTSLFALQFILFYSIPLTNNQLIQSPNLQLILPIPTSTDKMFFPIHETESKCEIHQLFFHKLKMPVLLSDDLIFLVKKYIILPFLQSTFHITNLLIMIPIYPYKIHNFIHTNVHANLIISYKLDFEETRQNQGCYSDCLNSYNNSFSFKSI